MRRKLAGPVVVAAVILSMHAAQAPAQPGETDAPPDQPQSQADEADRRDGEAQRDNGDPGARGFGRRGGRGPGGPRFFGGPRQEERKLVAKFDADKNGWLNALERAAARKELAAEPQDRGRGGRGFRGRGSEREEDSGPDFRGPDGEREQAGGPDGERPRRRRFGFMGPGRRRDLGPAKPGERVSPADVVNHPNAELYDPTVLRTIFVDFENADWEKELSDFHNSDVEVPAKLTVDGKEYPNVGIHFRGMSSYMGIPTGYKKSLNLSVDFINEDQRLYGYRTLNLLNGHDDNSLMSPVLYSHIARQYMPAPKANFVRVVINGEDWGVFANVQQFNKDFLQEGYGTGKGARWKVRGNPGGDAGLRYFGDDIKPYRERFTIKSKDDEKAWRDLIALCKTLEQTPPEKLQAELEPLLDIDGTLRFLALDVALVNMDGYWVRASDYSLYQDPTGRFHLIPADMNEAFRGGGGPRGGFFARGGRGRRGRGEGEEAREREPGDRQDDEQRDADGARDREDRPDADGADTDRAEDAPVEDVLVDNRGEQPREEGGRDRDEDNDRGSEPPFGPPGFGPPPGDGPPDGRPRFGGPGFGPPGFGGPGGGGVKLDPLVGLDSERMPLRSKLLAVPELKARYLEYVRAIAQDSLDWNKLGPVVADYRALISEAVERDTRKLSTYEEFLKATADEQVESEPNEREISLRTFAEKRREYLLDETKSRDSKSKDSQDTVEKSE